MENGEKVYWQDEYEISYIPSLYALSHIQAQVAQREKELVSSALIAGVQIYEPCDGDTNSGLPDLKYAYHEASEIAKQFHISPILNSDVTTDCLMASMPNANYIQLADIYENIRLKQARVVTLSACETGIIDLHIPEEAISLQEGFLQAGAENVISSHPVRDSATGLRTSTCP